MADMNKKRKERGTDDRGNRGPKRSKGGSGGKWQTPHQQARAAAPRGGKIEPGDQGIWATCARGQEGRATEELRGMLEECAERFYGLGADADDENDDTDDIEAAIQKEVAELGNKQSESKLFTPIHLDMVCVLFFKTRAPIEPVDFVHRICAEVVATPGIRKMKYVNRLTPMTLMARATERGLEEVSKTVLGPHFELKKTGDEGEAAAQSTETDASEGGSRVSYAIRPTFRNHTNPLKRDIVIKQIASSISDAHKVNLTTPDKVIIVEIYQTICGMSVVGNDWESLKRFNLAELYQQHDASKAGSEDSEAKP